MAYAAQAEPFIHLDADVILWKPIPARLRTAPVFAQNPEHFNFEEQSLYRPDNFMAAITELGGWLPTEWRQYAGRQRNAALCCGVFGGADVDFIGRYARLAIDIIRDPRNLAVRERIGVRDNILVEQYFLAACLEAGADWAATDQSGISSRPVRADYLFPSSADAFDPLQAERVGYTHLIGDAKADHAIADRLGRAGQGDASHSLRAVHGRGRRADSARGGWLSAERVQGRLVQCATRPMPIRRRPSRRFGNRRSGAAHFSTLLAVRTRESSRGQQAGDPCWTRVAAERYNQVCRDCASRRDESAPPDTYLDAIRGDPDLRAVCDNRWMLGEAVDALRSRLDRLDTIAAQHDDFERCIRQSVTGPDRSPAELAGGVDEAIANARRAAAWKLPVTSDGTLVDRWKRYLENNPIIAAIMIAGAAVVGAATVYKSLHDSGIASVPRRVEIHGNNRASKAAAPDLPSPSMAATPAGPTAVEQPK